MKRKIWVNKADSFKEANDFDQEYYLSMSPEERLSTVQFCREEYHKMVVRNENRKRFRRFFRVIKQK